MKPIVILFAIFVISEAALPLPSYINPCSQNDPELNQCFETNANDAIPYLAQGDSEYNVKTLMPHLKWRDLLEVHMPPVTLILIDNDLYGLENFTVSNPNVDLDRRAIAMTLTSPLITWKAKYQIELEVGGFSPSEKVEGNIIISFPNGVYDVSVEYEFIYINGLQFANVTNAFAQFENMDVSFNFVGSNWNPALETAWAVAKANFINQEVQEACGWIVASYINDIFNVVPFSQVFLP